jgi:hypothetical protein
MRIFVVLVRVFLFGTAAFFLDIPDTAIFNFAFQARRPMQISLSNDAGIIRADIFFEHIFLS